MTVQCDETVRETAPEGGDDIEVSVVMPCLNEERTVGRCVEKARRTLRELGIESEVVIVRIFYGGRDYETALLRGIED